MSDFFQRFGRGWLQIFERLGRAHLFLFQILIGLPSLFGRGSLLVKQLYSTGVMTLLIILVSGLFVGMVLALQGYYSLVRFSAEEALGQFIAQVLFRELAPVLTALLFAGRAGSALTSEIGLMKATEQLSGLEMMAVDPYKRIYAPRLLAGFIAVPALTAMFGAVAILGGHLVGVEMLGVDAGAYWSQMKAEVSFGHDVMSGMYKALVFGFIICWIAIFEGADCIPTSEGVSSSTTNTVVYSSLAILGLDFVLTALMF